jgi:NAD(P)-dependent dehydrogenase (short-subunit alcohol dehydrogenase family)
LLTEPTSGGRRVTAMIARVSSAIDLTGKVALVTGGSRGLGREMVLAFARAGADVVVSSRKLEACEAVAAEVEGLGRHALAVAAHAGRWEDMDRLAEIAYERFGRVDVLVNNAGMSPLFESLDTISEELFDKVVSVNFKGPFRLSSIVGTRMVRGGGGTIINISSTASLRPHWQLMPYAAAKTAVNTMTAALAGAFGPTVRVNAIAPGTFLTDISKAWDMEAFERLAREDFPLERGGRPEEITGLALYLASDASSYMSGATIPLDGGAMWGKRNPTG